MWTAQPIAGTNAACVYIIGSRGGRDSIINLERIDKQLTKAFAAHGSKAVCLLINSPGGSVTSGFAMFDTMRHIKADVSTINVGLAASMGSFLLMGGTKGKRLALPHSRTMIHQPAMGGFQGQAADVKVEAEQILAVRKRCVDYYASCCGQPRERVELDLDRDNFFGAEEAMEYGLVDRVLPWGTKAVDTNAFRETRI